jgi:hypothetical protein
MDDAAADALFQLGEADESELQEIYDRYHNKDGTAKDGWLKAPNGQPTNLTERQWLVVRTKNFKKWFGDWEALAIQAQFDLLVKEATDENKIKNDQLTSKMYLREVTQE